MKTVTININGKDTEITLTKEQLEQINKSNSMFEVYKFNNTTEEDFDKLYEKLPLNIKAYAKEVLVVNYFNKGWKPNLNDLNEKKWYLWFYLDNFRLDVCGYCYSYSGVPASLLFKSREDALEAFRLFPDVFEESRRL